MNWPILNTRHSSTIFWGWALIVLGVLTVVIIGLMFAIDVVPTLRKRKYHAALFGMSFVAIAITAGAHAILRGYYTINFDLTPRGVKPLDIGSIIMCYPPIVLFGLERLRALRGKDEWRVQGNPLWLFGIVAVVAFYTGSFVMRFADAVSLKHVPLHWARFDSDYNLVLWGLYLACAFLWLRFQVRIRSRTGGWNVSGMTIGLIFVALSFQRLAQSIEVSSGAYMIQDRAVSGYLWVDLTSIVAVMGLFAVSLSSQVVRYPKKAMTIRARLGLPSFTE